MNAKVMEELVAKGAVWLRKDKNGKPTETAADFAEEVYQNMRYVIFEKAKEETVVGNSGAEEHKDTGHDGWDLAEFHRKKESVMAELLKAEVAALRLYTSSTFRVINGPLRVNTSASIVAEDYLSAGLDGACCNGAWGGHGWICGTYGWGFGGQ